MRKPWLWLPARVAHDLSPFYLHARSYIAKPATYEWRPLEWKGLRFSNRLGLAGGVDKNASSTRAWWTFGPGFVEVGTVTPRPQGPNPGKIMARDLGRSALWNKMGFPNAGAERVAANLEKLGRPHHTPLFINIGKNRDTPNERAADDYVFCLTRLWSFADAFVVNISSPNTSGLRELLKPENLSGFLRPIVDARQRLSATGPSRPLLLKLSPDLTPQDQERALLVSAEMGFDGWIISNTTLSRQPGCSFPTDGGVSGAPLAPLARESLAHAIRVLGERRQGRLLISAGGVMSARDVRERLEMGADLVQVYAALIFEGPGFFRRIAHEIGAHH